MAIDRRAGNHGSVDGSGSGVSCWRAVGFVATVKARRLLKKTGADKTMLSTKSGGGQGMKGKSGRKGGMVERFPGARRSWLDKILAKRLEAPYPRDRCFGRDTRASLVAIASVAMIRFRATQNRYEPGAGRLTASVISRGEPSCRNRAGDL